MKNLISIVVFIFCSGLLFAQPAVDLSPEEMQQVLRIAKTIRLAKPALDDGKCIEYSIAVYRASNRFKIDANLLIAIAAQETYFREDLPEGKAGEFGIVQIRKMWINNPQFQAVFKNAKVKDLNNPAKAFMFAAWILRDLKNTAKKSAIPYWSYYNAKKFHNRMKYYLAVNRKLVYLNKGESIPISVQADIQKNGRAKGAAWKPEKLLASNVEADRGVATWKPSELPEPAALPAQPVLVSSEAKTELITTASLGSGITIRKGGWIDFALKKLRGSPPPTMKDLKPKNKQTLLLEPTNPQMKAENEYRSRLFRSIQD